MISEREKLEFESLPEFVREPRTSSKDSYKESYKDTYNKDTYKDSYNSSVPKMTHIDEGESAGSKAAELEVLWGPNVNNELLHAARRTSPTVYLGVGFGGGVVVTLVLVWAVSFFTHIGPSQPQQKKIVVAGEQPTAKLRNGIATERGTGSAVVTTVQASAGVPEVIVPVTSQYEVASGDTLAGIALKNYKRATPRLLDEICRANNMSNANVLSLGQKLILPDYRPARQIATGGSSVQQ